MRAYRVVFLVAACSCAMSTVALADTWDNSAGTSQWSTATNWADNTEPTINDFATFPNTIPGGLSTIVLSSGEFAQSLTFLNNYTLTGGNIQLGNGMITAGGWSSNITTVLAGTGPLTFGSSGTITLGATSNSYTGGTIINGTSMTLVIRSNSQLGFNTAPVNLNGGHLRLDGSVNPTFLMSRTVTLGSGGGTIELQNGAALRLLNALGATSNALTFTGTGSAQVDNSSGRIGTTTINGPTVRIYHPLALGTGATNLFNGGALELFHTSLAYTSPLGFGSLSVLRGLTNSDTDEIILNSPCNIFGSDLTLDVQSLSVLNPGMLTLGGSGADVLTNGAMSTIKVVGNGTVNLASANSYAGGWEVGAPSEFSILRVSHPGALGTGAAPIVVTPTGRLQLNTPTLARDITLNNPGAGIVLLQDATVIGQIPIAPNAGFVPIRGTDYEFTLAGAGSSMTYTGTAYFGGSIGPGSMRVIDGAGVTGTSTRVFGPVGGSSSLTVSGAGSSWQNTDETWFGNSGGTASVLVEGGGSISCPRVYVGQGEDASATVTGEGSLLSCADLLEVGFASVGTLSVLDGADVVAGQTRVGDLSGASGAITVSGTGSTLTAQPLSLGLNASGALNVTNGGQVTCQALLLGDGAGAPASGTVTISGPLSSFECNGGPVFMSLNDASSALNLLGGIVDIHGDITDAGPGVSTLVLDGATLDMHNSAIGGASPIDNLQFKSGTLKNVSEINGGAGLTKTGPGTLYLNTANSYGGTTLVSEGTLFVVNSIGSATGSGPVLVPPDATLAGPGQIAGPLNTNGHVAPEGFAGNPFGTLTVENNYNQSLGGTLHIDVGGPTQFDRLVLINGAATLDGTLNVNLMNGFVPAAGDTFEILSAVLVSGTFASANLPNLPDQLEWQIEYGPMNVRLKVISSEILGDVNHDGHIDLGDVSPFIAVLLGLDADPSHIMSADVNQDGTADGADIQSFIALL